jgi:glyoxylase-like metal-dependent hydrolase (beta-lactamase superfamily II)
MDSTTVSNPYEVYALRYGSRSNITSKEIFFRYELYDEPERSYRLDYFFWLLRNGDRTVLVDCGFSPEQAAERGRPIDVDPIDLLARLDVSASDVDHVVLSHMHSDHVGNAGLFPNATFSMARAELDYWTGPYSDRPCVSWLVAASEVQAILELHRQGRLCLVDEPSEELFAGVRLIRLPGHTPGQLVTEITTETGQVLLASDAIHLYDEMQLDRPFHVFTDLEGMYRTYEMLRNIASQGTSIVAGHDSNVMKLFELVAEDCVDLTRRRQ